MHVAAGFSNANDFVPIRQGVDRCLTNGAGGANDNYFHGVIPAIFSAEQPGHSAQPFA
jgi:hypothetical protein